MHPSLAALTKLEDIAYRKNVRPESLQIGAEPSQVLVTPAVEVKTYSPYADGQVSKSPHLLWNPDHAALVCVGIKRVAIVNHVHAHSQQNVDRVGIEGVRRRHPHVGLYPVFMKDPRRILQFDLLHLVRQSRKFAQG